MGSWNCASDNRPATIGDQNGVAARTLFFSPISVNGDFKLDAPKGFSGLSIRSAYITESAFRGWLLLVSISGTDGAAADGQFKFLSRQMSHIIQMPLTLPPPR
jgi:hypothetical protein